MARSLPLVFCVSTLLGLAAACAPGLTLNTPCTKCAEPKTATGCKIAGHDDWTCGKLSITYSLSPNMCGIATLTCFAEFGKATFAAVGVENDEFSSPAGNGTAAINDLAFITDVQKLMATTQILCNQNSTWVAPHEFGLGDLDAKDAFYCINFKKEP